MDYKTSRRGLDEFQIDQCNSSQIRQLGGGRKKISDQNSEAIKLIEELIESDTRGDPESPLRWTCKNVRNVADFLNKSMSHQTVASILRKLEYSLQGNRKTKEGSSPPDRDEQFKYINKSVKKFIANKEPIISVDTKFLLNN